jgi:hypothetical protein
VQNDGNWVGEYCAMIGDTLSRKQHLFADGDCLTPTTAANCAGTDTGSAAQGPSPVAILTEMSVTAATTSAVDKPLSATEQRWFDNHAIATLVLRPAVGRGHDPHQFAPRNQTAMAVGCVDKFEIVPTYPCEDGPNHYPADRRQPGFGRIGNAQRQERRSATRRANRWIDDDGAHQDVRNSVIVLARRKSSTDDGRFGTFDAQCPG